MSFYLTDEQIKLYVEKYGDGDIYFSHEYLNDGRIKVKYFPVLNKFVSEENIPYLFEELQVSPHLIPKYTRELFLNDKIAYVLFDEKRINNTLTKNYKKFLEDLKNNKLVYPQKKEEQKTKNINNKNDKQKYSKKKEVYNRNKEKSKLFDFSKTD